MRNFFDAETSVKAFKGLLGVVSTSGGFYVSLQHFELWLRVVSLLVGIAVGIATFVSIMWGKKEKKRHKHKNGLDRILESLD